MTQLVAEASTALLALFVAVTLLVAAAMPLVVYLLLRLLLERLAR